MTLADRVVVMNKGVIQQVGTPDRHLRQPGQHLRRGLHRLAGDEPRRRHDHRTACSMRRACEVTGLPEMSTGPVTLGFRAEDAIDGAGRRQIAAPESTRWSCSARRRWSASASARRWCRSKVRRNTAPTSASRPRRDPGRDLPPVRRQDRRQAGKRGEGQLRCAPPSMAIGALPKPRRARMHDRAAVQQGIFCMTPHPILRAPHA